MMTAIRLPGFLQRRVNAAVDSLLNGQPGDGIDFSSPHGEEALMAPNSVSWRIFKNPVALFVGGTAAVILELAEPAVRAGVWEHSSFRKNPIARLQRTGLAAMITVYGARRVAESMIRRVVRMHAAVHGTSPQGISYSANDPRLLNWVHGTATYGFSAAYDRYVARLQGAEFDRLYREGEPAARLYGADAAPRSLAEMQAMFEGARQLLDPSAIVFDFLNIMSETPALPAALHWMQKILVRAAVELVPAWIRVRLGLGDQYRLQPQERWLARLAGAAAERVLVPSSPAVQACLRLGLPSAYLYSRGRYAYAEAAPQLLDYQPQPAYFAKQSETNS
jgi:uncharacterized protein (DUF2236 family)